MKTIFIGGAWDLFHDGHLLTLEKAKKLRDRLVVLVNSDARIRFRKGNNRPIIPQKSRARILEALRIVDEVVLGTSKGPVPEDLDTIRLVKPDKWVLHRDPTPEEEAVKDLGIEIVRFPYIKSPSGLNTTKIIDKIRKGDKVNIVTKKKVGEYK
ncbi:hypothetical protein LCGC14_2362510 [marine sediment metagenome]|uniref:Cytidyltransferase-like domain-containing protein n=1 Tax=marine sediment metagenome TaxID=412755 RepID=A0A0F9EIQ8_9ZZZZ|nr:D-glycero-beta-D-manno-heptose 1-phosphate adenylyltransferase [Candidatus Scalindua sp.]